MNSRFPFFFTILVILVIFSFEQSTWPAQESNAANDNGPILSPLDKVGDAVWNLLQTEGKAAVVIALVPPTTGQATANLPALRAETAQLQARVLAAVNTADFTVRHTFQAVPALSGTILSSDGLNQLAAHPEVLRIDLDVGGQGSLDVSVPLIGADEQQAMGITGSGVVVAVLDTGLDTDHSDLSSDLIHQQCFLDNDGLINGIGLCPNGSDRQSGAGSAEDGAGHGTHVTGIVTSDGNVSSVGVAPDAEIVAIKVLDNSSFSGTFYFFSEIVAALDYIINNQPTVQVINMSLGTFATFVGNCDNSTAYNMAGAAAINTLRTNGVIAFASSGNSGSGTVMTSPACLSNVISVGATDDSDEVATFTNSNSVLDIMAPGVGIISDAIGNGTTNASGTSMASPHAAGCAALLIQSGAATNPDQIESRLKTSAVQVTDPTNGLTFPRIDCHPALSTPTPTATATGTSTPDITDTPTATSTPTLTATPAETAIPTSTPTATATETLTSTPASPLTPAATNTATSTPTNTAVPPTYGLFLPLIQG